MTGMTTQNTLQREQYSELQHWAIGVALADPENQIDVLLTHVHPDAIAEPRLRPIYDAIKTISETHVAPPTASDVGLWLQTNNSAGYEAVDGMNGINILVEMGEDAILTHNNISIIHEALNSASYYVAMEELTTRFYYGIHKVALEELEKFTDEAIRKLQDLRASYAVNLDEYSHDAAEIMEALDKELEDARNGEGATGIPLFNFPRLSTYLGGLRPGNLTIVAARPAIGKTTFCCNIIAPLCEAGLSVQFFSIEMSATEIMKNVLSCRFGIPRGDFNNDDGLTYEKQVVFNEALNLVPHWKFNVVDKQGINILELRQKSKRLAESETGLDILVVDYIQILGSDPGAKSENAQERLATVTYELKFLAMELGVPIVATCQLGRPATGEREQPPTASSIRGSDAILQAANHVIALHRDRVEMPDSTDAIILKNRSGPADITIQIDTALNICFFAEDMNEVLTSRRKSNGDGGGYRVQPAPTYELNNTYDPTNY